MIFGRVIVALALSVGFLEVASAQANTGGNGNGNQEGGGNNNGGNKQGNDNTGTATTDQNAQAVLDPANIQSASASDGQGQGVDGVKDGQAPSATDAANFINFCSGKKLTNGLQEKGGSCNGIPMGDIPATTNMVSTVITNPTGGCIQANKDFDITLQVANLNAGVFVNPTVAYYTAPQALDKGNGNIIGHVHVTVQSTGNNLNPTSPLDSTIFVFFKGIDNKGDGNGGLKAAVAGGLPPGNYRLCTMSAAANHQPVTMPVAQRGAQDDCRYFSTSDNCAAQEGNGNGNNANGNNANGDNANGNNANGNNANGNNANGNNANGNNADGNSADGNNADGNNADGNNANGNDGGGANKNSGRGASGGDAGASSSSAAAAAAATATNIPGGGKLGGGSKNGVNFDNSTSAADTNNGGGQGQQSGGQGNQQGGAQQFGQGGRGRRQRQRFQKRAYVL